MRNRFGLQQAQFPGAGDGLHTALHAQFAVDGMYVGLDCAHDEHQPCSNLSVG